MYQLVASHEHSATADGGHNRDLISGKYGGNHSACVPDIFFSHEDIDVLPDESLFRQDTIPNAWAGGG